jgi:hypothetical protein
MPFTCITAKQRGSQHHRRVIVIRHHQGKLHIQTTQQTLLYRLK